MTVESHTLADMQIQQREIPPMLSELRSRQHEMDQELTRLARTTAESAVQGDPNDNEREVLDRTKLKERLKKSLMLNTDPLAGIPEAPSAWMELIFGIHAPDQRMGREGSRFPALPHACAQPLSRRTAPVLRATIDGRRRPPAG